MIVSYWYLTTDGKSHGLYQCDEADFQQFCNHLPDNVSEVKKVVGNMMMFCTRKGDNVSRWYDYPRTVEEFIDMHGSFIQKGVVWCFVENEHVWLYDEDGLYEVPELPDWVPDFDYPEF